MIWLADIDRRVMTGQTSLVFAQTSCVNMLLSSTQSTEFILVITTFLSPTMMEVGFGRRKYLGG